MREMWKNEKLCLKLIYLVRDKKVKNFGELAQLMETDNSESLRTKLCKYLPGIDALIRRNNAEHMVEQCTESGDHEGIRKWTKQLLRCMLEYDSHGIPLKLKPGFLEGK